MRRAAWAVVAAVGLSACTGAAKTSTSTQTTRPSTVATTPATSGTPTSTASGPAATTASPTGGTAAAGTRADYLAQAKPICETATKIIDALPDPGNNQDENLKILDQRAAALNEALNKLQSLTPPAKDQSTVKFIVDHLTAVRDDTSGQAAGLRAGDTVKAGQLEARFDGDENVAKNAANDYGLGDCGA
ncbi:MAG TPA: hypothetical protein VKJ83_03550 [Actinomycetota bacterium]|nr:hypothetical protein [Actinomycetota bacterium]